MEILNKKEFIELRKLYQFLTVNKLKEKLSKLDLKDDFESFGDYFMNIVSGFGASSSCSLCEPIIYTADDCNGCIYRYINENKHINFPCVRIDTSYDDISDASNIKELHIALRKRIKFMLSIEKRLKIK